MSVILFSKSAVYQEMADSYEGLKQLLVPYAGSDDTQFYKSLRRLYYANVAAYLCQYHDDTPLSDDELRSIDGFQALIGVNKPVLTAAEKLHAFIEAWDGLKYNLITNDGEVYVAKEAEQYFDQLVQQWTRRVIAAATEAY